MCMTDKQKFEWDKYSDQPYIITNKRFKKQKKRKYFFAHLALFLLFIGVFLLAFFWQFLMRFPKARTQIGVGVNLDKGRVQYELVEELGVQNLIIRIPLADIDNIDNYVDFVAGFRGKTILINILQNRENIENDALLEKNVRLIFEKLQHLVTEYQVGNAVNRTKWGFFTVGEYLDFYQLVQKIKDEQFPNLQLIGPSVIDFEYHYTIGSLFHQKKIKFDKLSALLYVDRRGSPYNRQYGFNLKNKITLLSAIVHLANKSNNEIYITETNYPLKDTAPYAPTSEKECVSEKDYAKYMRQYFDIVRKSGKISRVYWHQLVAPGYGLVDNRAGKIRKMPAFYSFKKIINEKNSN